MTKTFLTRPVALAAVLAVSSIYVNRASAQSLTRIPTFGGNSFQSTSSQILVSINSSGTVAGASQNASSNFHAYTLAPGSSTPTDIGLVPTSPNGAYAFAYGINAGGQIVGSINATNFSNRAYIYTPGSTAGTGGTAINVLDQANISTALASSAYGINSAGTAVGTVSFTYLDGGSPKTTGQGFVYLNNTMYTLGSLNGATGSSNAIAINNSNVIIGSSTVASGQQRAYSYALTTDVNGAPNGTMVQLPTLGGASNAAYAINNAGDIVGWSNNAASTRHAFLLMAGSSTPVDLDVTSVRAEAYALNNVGEVVGYDYFANGIQRAALWTNGTAIDLNAYYHSFVPLADPNLTLTAAYGINDAHQIVGIGTDSSTGRGINFVLSVPEPASLGLISMLGVAALGRRRR